MKITVKERCSEAYHAEKDGKEFQVGLRFEDGTATYPKKCTVIIDGNEETVDIGEGDDRIKKAVKAGAEKLGYKIVESAGKKSESAEAMERGTQQPKELAKTTKSEGRRHLGRCKNCGHGWAKMNYLDELEPAIRKYFKGKGYPDNADICPKCVAAATDYLAQKPASHDESMEGWDDWEEIEGLEDALYSIEDLAYELRNCVRGANTNCKTWAELSKYVVSLADALRGAGEDLKYKQDAED